ncbi:MAG: flagellin, partial [Pseudomonadota bacterium]|nr:flagellin [Pseudomonadota bacterium]
MSLVINTNIASITAQRALQGTGDELATAMERLATGSKINSSADDAAGLAIGQRMTAQVKGLNMAVKNAGDGMAMTQTVEGALNTISDMLQRMRELAVQSVNATNSSRDRSFLQEEVNQLTQEINRVSATSQFNGEKILDGTFVNKTIQLGMEEGERLTISVPSIAADQIGAYTYTGNGTAAAAIAATPAANVVTALEDLTIVGPLGTASTSAAANDTAKLTVNKINALTSQTGVSATAQTYLQLASSNAAEESYSIHINGVSSGNFTISSASVEDAVRAINSVSGATGVTATSTSDGKVLMFDNDG